MKKPLIGLIGKLIGIFALLTTLSAFAELGRPCAYQALKEREHARICERIREIISLQTPETLLNYPHAEVLPDGCVK